MPLNCERATCASATPQRIRLTTTTTDLQALAVVIVVLFEAFQQHQTWTFRSNCDHMTIEPSGAASKPVAETTRERGISAIVDTLRVAES